MDIYRYQINKNASQTHLVKVGRWVTAIALVLAVIVTPAVASMGKLFSFIQEYTGFISPGVLVIFLLGLFWKRTTSSAALWTVLLTIPFSILFKLTLPDLAFLDRMMLTFLILMAVAIAISLRERYVYKPYYEGDSLSSGSSAIFNIGALIITGLIAVFYILFW